MLEQFIHAVGGATPAAAVLGVSGTIIHRWKREGPSAKAERRMALWLAYNVEHERFIMRNVWAREDRVWTPSEDDFRAWAINEFNLLRARVGLERSAALWTEVMT
jgi:hypothetical protein